MWFLCQSLKKFNQFVMSVRIITEGGLHRSCQVVCGFG